MPFMDIGQNIRSRRKELKMTLEQLALEIGSDTGNLSRIERGQQSITTDKIEVIAKALNCLPLDLINPSHSSQPSVPFGYNKVPLLSNNQSLDWSKLQTHVEHLDIKEWLVTDLSIAPNSFSFLIWDLSMAPDFKIGDKIIIDPSLKAEAGDFVIARDERYGLIFRKYRARGISDDDQEIFELFPLNEDFENFHSLNSGVSVIGVMVEHRKYRQK